MNRKLKKTKCKKKYNFRNITFQEKIVNIVIDISIWIVIKMSRKMIILL